MSLRARILLLVLFATLAPAVALTVFVVRERAADVAEAQRKLAAATQRIAQELNDGVRATAQLQYGLARTRNLDNGDRAACSAFLAGALREYPQYTGILTIRPDGELFCDSLRSGRTLNLSDRRYFQQALTSSTPLALEPVFGRLTGIPVLQVAYAARSDEGRIKYVLLASLNLERFTESRARGLPFDTAVLALVDGKGTLLAWHPGGEKLRGTSIAGSPLDLLARGRDNKHLSEEVNIGGVPRLWTVAALPDFSEAGLSVLVGVSREALSAAADQRLGRTLVILGSVCLLAIIGAWTLATRIQTQNGEILRLNEDLERRVAGRTVELARKNVDLEDANRAKSEFLSRMSHELRTPLNAIVGFGQLLEMSATTEDDRESVDQVLRAGRHLLGLINEVLDLARIEAGHVHVSLEPVHVRDVFTRVLDLVRPLAAQRRIETRAENAAALDAYVMADNQRLQQVVLNLASNGIKYSREGGQLTLVTEARPAGRMRIAVTDTGPGIPPALLPRLFTPFERLGAEQQGIEGTGLGLALVKGLVEAMGGRVGVESVEGQGSTFWVELACADAPVDQPRQPDGEEAAPVSSTMARRTVLYIEDNLSNLRLIERVLAQRPGITLIPAMQGTLGLELARQHRPDLVLLDLHLPGLSGEQVLRELRADPTLRHIPVIVLSADAAERTIERLRGAGAQGYLTKPLDVRQLLALIDETLIDETLIDRAST